MNKHERLILGSQIGEINRLIGFIENICAEHNIYNNYYANIVTATTEAFLNALQHGNKKDNSKIIIIDFQVENDGFSFCISDQGMGFNPENIPDPTDINIKEDSIGKGIFLMKSLSDFLEFREGGKQVCMKFLISSINKDIAMHRVNKLKSFLKQEANHNS